MPGLAGGQAHSASGQAVEIPPDQGRPDTPIEIPSDLGQADTPDVAQTLRSQWETAELPRGDFISPEAVRRVYQARNFMPLFIGSPGSVDLVTNLVREIRQSGTHGLPPARYGLPEVHAALAELPAAHRPWWAFLSGSGQRNLALARLDALLVDRYMALARDLRFGEAEALPVPSPPMGPDSAAILSNNPAAADSPGTPPKDSAVADTVVGTLSQGRLPPVESWAPTHPQYAALRKWLQVYRGVVARGGWPSISPGGTLRKGDRGERVAEVRRRLDAEQAALTGAAPETSPEPAYYDAGLADRIKRFQERHALDTDGAVGKGTLVELNLSAEARVRQIEVCLARWRKGPRDEPPYRVEINIPGMMVYLFRSGKPVLGLRAVVGSGRESPKWRGKSSVAQTPELVDEIETIEVNPRWYIPEIIVRTELLAKEKRKPGFLDKGGYEWYDPRTGQHGPASEIPEADWGDPSKKLYLRQKSGYSNSLGRIKFVFRNAYAVYLHDTPEKHLFLRGKRNFSHGCVRVQNPAWLADSLLAYSLRQPPRPLKRLLADTSRVVLPLKPPVPIHLVYRTVWVENDSTIVFPADLYGLDAAMEESILPESGVSLLPGAAGGAGGAATAGAAGDTRAPAAAQRAGAAAGPAPAAAKPTPP